MSLIHYELHTTADVPLLIDSLNDLFRLKRLQPLGAPVAMMGNHKLLTLRSYKKETIRISGPSEIVDDFFLIYFCS
jgi:hypothetical protein